jgi:hypothetical protein
VTSFLHQPNGARTLFGMPTVQTASEAAKLRDGLRRLWELVYQQPLGNLDADLELCRNFFDPVARGHKLRERLTALPPAPVDMRQRQDEGTLGEPIVTDAGAGRLLVGIEGRLLLQVLAEFADATGRVVVPPTAVLAAERRVVATYREWTRHRLGQVIALQAGQGSEVMQATSVGIVLALLVNRSTTPERGISRLPNEQIDERVDEALHAAADAFADTITSARQRSRREQRLRGGFHITEARRRLANRLVITGARRGEASLVYIPQDQQEEVVEFVARDLARRENLEVASLAAGFDKLVAAFRRWSAQLASHGMIFEQPADTARLREQLLAAFTAARAETQRSQPAIFDEIRS